MKVLTKLLPVKEMTTQLIRYLITYTLNGKNFRNDGLRNRLMFQPLLTFFTMHIDDNVFAWKSKWSSKKPLNHLMHQVIALLRNCTSVIIKRWDQILKKRWLK